MRPIAHPAMEPVPTRGATYPSNDCTLFGYDWPARTYGLGVIKVESTTDGIVAIEAVPYPKILPASFQSSYAISKTVHWFELVGDEYLNEVQLYPPNFWYGKCEGKMERIVPPEGCYLHMVHGANSNGKCERLGAYAVPISLFENEASQCVRLLDSKGVERVPFDASSLAYFESSAGSVRAVVFVANDRNCKAVQFLDSIEYGRHLTIRDTPLPLGTHVLVLIAGEFITGLHASVPGGCIASIQLVTTLRQTEWFGPVPGGEATVKTLEVNMEDSSEMRIGGVFGMLDTQRDSLQSINVGTYQRF